VHIVNLLFSFHGRINRAQYWLGGLGAGFLASIAIFFMAFIIAPPDGAKPDPMAQATLTLAAFAPVFLGMIWACLAIQVKRFHDRGRSGWFSLIPLIPGLIISTIVIGGVMTDAPGAQVVPQILPWFGISGLINLALFVDLGLMPGNNGPNKFGDPPGSGSPSTQFKPPNAAPAPSSLSSASSALDAAIVQRKTPNLSALGIAPQPGAATPAPAPQRAPAPTLARAGAPTSFGRRTTS
jgi:uncharacterized membrane protein YhaH (DUF805 family)